MIKMLFSIVDILNFQSERDSVNLVVSRNVIFLKTFVVIFNCSILFNQLYTFFFLFCDHNVKYT